MVEKKKKKEETVQRAAAFRDLPRWLRIFVINVSLLLLFTALFFLAGKYLYSPQGAARSYVEAQLAGDWNTAYDSCEFPESAFLSRKNYVNAMYALEEKEGTAKGQTIKNFVIRRQPGRETGTRRIYEVTYTLQGVSESKQELLAIGRGPKALASFYEWYVRPENAYVAEIAITVPSDADFYLDGTLITDKYLSGEEEEKKVYTIPYLFVGGHTVELTQKGGEDYRDVILVKDENDLEILPEMKLNDSTGREIADRVESALDRVLSAAAEKADFRAVQEEFSSESQVREKASQAYEALCGRFADENHTGIVNMVVTVMDTTISSESGAMKAEVMLSCMEEKTEKFLLFFYRTKTESTSYELQVEIYRQKDRWVMGEGLLELGREKTSSDGK